MSKTIVAKHGEKILVDDDVYEWASRYKWYLAHGYVLRREFPSRRTIYLHREVMGVGSGHEVDHISHNKLDNRRQNLRVCTHQQNASAQRKQRTPTSSRYKGVSWHPRSNKWRARIKMNGVERHIGIFDSEDAAAHAYDEAAKETFGAFAITNF